MKVPLPPVPPGCHRKREFDREPMRFVHDRSLSLDYTKAASAHSPAATTKLADDLGKVFVPDLNSSGESLEIPAAEYFPQSNSD